MVVASAAVAILISWVFGWVVAWREGTAEDVEVPVAAEVLDADGDEPRRWPYLSASKP